MVQKKQVIAAAAFFIVMALTVGFFALASDLGGRENPLVTLDYLKSLDPQIEATIAAVVREQVNSQTSEISELIRQAGELSGAGGALDMDALLNNQDFIDRIAAAVAGQMGGGTGALDPSGAYLVAQRVEVESGKKLHLPMGSSIVLRLGRGTVSASNDPGLICTTTGEPLNNGVVLRPNYKYFVSMTDGRDIVCSEKMTVFIWGAYSIS